MYRHSGDESVSPETYTAHETFRDDTDTSPQETGDSFFPEFSAEVIDIRQTDHLRIRAGDIRFNHATFDDGSLYPILVATPRHQRSDTAIASTTAWLTSTKGHNRLTLEDTMRLGYKHIMIGPEGEVQNPDLSFIDRLKLAQQTSLPRTAYNMNRILDHTLRFEDHVREDEVIVVGGSRGAMTGFGFGTEQYSRNRRIAYADLTAPCFPKTAQLQELPGVVAQLAPEVLTLGKLGLQLFGSKLRHYPATFQKDPEYYLHALATIPHLLSGDAGKLAKSIPKDTPMHIQMFHSDSWCQGESWKDIFEDFSRVALSYDKGRHLDIANPKIIQAIGTRLGVLSQIRGFDGSFDNVDFTQVQTAHQAN